MSTQSTPDQQANYIKTLRIKGFKKFTDLTVDFNPNVNIIVGENGSGKSTILEAIKVVLNQQNKNSDRSFLEDWFNVEAKDAFQQNPCIETLPKIEIEVELSLNPSNTKSINFHGEYHSQKREAVSNKSKISKEASKERYGITFRCFYDPTDNEDLDAFIEEVNSGVIYQPSVFALYFVGIILCISIVGILLLNAWVRCYYKVNKSGMVWCVREGVNIYAFANRSKINLVNEIWRSASYIRGKRKQYIK